MEPIKLKRDTVGSKRDSLITRFEYLSNEIIYEIFDFLDFVQTYDTFSSLNKRFQNLFINSNQPINIKLSLISKSIFQRFYTEIITSKQHRIKSFDVSNPFIIDHIFSSISILSNFIQLENLSFHDIKSDYLNQLLIHLHSLPSLSSLIIHCIDNVQNKNIIYRRIFRLPVLKYCKLSLNEPFSLISLLIATNEFSSIENLIITNVLRFDELNGLLSYVPKLRRLSVNLSNIYSEEYNKEYSIHLNHLTHVELNLSNMNFDEFELIIKNLFNRIEVLYISSLANETYLDEYRWKQLILSHMHHLRIFDIMIKHDLDLNEDILEKISLINRFQSRFWFERGWFFEYEICYDYDDLCCLIFYSINPYRRKSYIIYISPDMKNSSFDRKHKINSVQHLKSEEHEDIINYKYYFPNVTKLTLSHFFKKQNTNFLSTSFNNIIPLKQLTKLIIETDFDSFVEIIDLLYLSPNIHTFQIDLVSHEYTDLISIENNRTFQLVSKRNNIKQMSILINCTLEITKFFINLCPRLQYLIVQIPNDNIEPILSFLFSKDNYNIQNLFSLCIKFMSNQQFDILNDFIVSKNLFDIYLTRIKRDINDYDVYLWW
ncbi:unnamed protein product [Rotaria sp. Silwood1]|nr:unnamed protein product [Rotaria sp. Silwood1]CAF1619872.1 unnamed protein product [Rotaria sp. Silwood1]CAF3710382.1 unnamed protein product [Rotaria sp. Silwood1]CAF4783657.1 unnamed protein product [Rotaria sp. Silwood1]